MKRPETKDKNPSFAHRIRAEDLVLMDTAPKDANFRDANFRIDLAYASPDNLLFGERIYKPQARLSLHRDLAGIVEIAARNAKPLGLRLVLYDGLRTIEAQEKMLHTQRVRENPRWLEEPRLLSPPGAGGHPRGMAIDLSLETAAGVLLDMGTPFDFLAADPSPAHNPAHRAFEALTPEISENRAVLERLMLEAANTLKRPLLPLPQEWWDFRLPPDTFNLYAPLHDSDLPAMFRLCDEAPPT